MKSLEDIFSNLNQDEQLVVLFGSRANKAHHENSDFDIGILCPGKLDFKKFMKIHNALEDELKTDVDLIDLRTADPIIAMQIVSNGKVIREDTPGRFACYQADTWTRYIDFKQSRKVIDDKILEDAKAQK